MVRRTIRQLIRYTSVCLPETTISISRTRTTETIIDMVPSVHLENTIWIQQNIIIRTTTTIKQPYNHQSSIINITSFVASLFAPADRSSCTTAACPLLAAAKRGVHCIYKIVRDNSLYNNEKKKNMNFHAARSS